MPNGPVTPPAPAGGGIMPHLSPRRHRLITPTAQQTDCLRLPSSAGPKLPFPITRTTNNRTAAHRHGRSVSRFTGCRHRSESSRRQHAYLSPGEPAADSRLLINLTLLTGTPHASPPTTGDIKTPARRAHGQTSGNFNETL